VPVRLISSTRNDNFPDFSSDGKRIAFASDRSGSLEIWMCDSEGLRPVQLTQFGGPVTNAPRWSPDGQHIAFESRPTGNFDIYVISVEGGPPRRLTTGAAEDEVPRWSRDGRFVYFTSNRSGAWEIWKVPAEGGNASQVTQAGGFEAIESVDGRFLYYLKDFSKAGAVWRVPVEGGSEARILENVVWSNWDVLERGICLVRRETTSQPTIEFFGFTSGQVRRIAALDKEARPGGPWGFTVSPDGQWILFTQVDQADNDIMMVENFH
jgi:Tol biopolymer transport system component